MDRVGLFAYRTVGFSADSLSPPVYEECPGTPQQLKLSVVLYEVCQRLRAAASVPTVEPGTFKTPGQQAGEDLAEAAKSLPHGPVDF